MDPFRGNSPQPEVFSAPGEEDETPELPGVPDVPDLPDVPDTPGAESQPQQTTPQSIEMTLPEDLDTLPMDLVEVVEDAPKPKRKTKSKQGKTQSRPAFEANFPPEAIKQLNDLKANLARKDKQIEQVMGAYREIKGETEKLRERIKKVERRKFEQSKGDFIARFVEVLDNLDRAINSIEEAFDPDAVLQGIILVRSRLVQLLREEGLEKIFVGGQAFDPTYSEAAGMEEVGSAEEEGIVLKELQRGYLLKGALLRAARVIVGRYVGDSAPTPTQDTAAPDVPPQPAKPDEQAAPPPLPIPAAPAPSPSPDDLAPSQSELSLVSEAADQILDELDNFIAQVPEPAPLEPAAQPPPNDPVPAVAPVARVPEAVAPHTAAPLPPDSDDTIIQELPAPIPDLLVPPENFPEAKAKPPAPGRASKTRPATPPGQPDNPLLQDDIFDQEGDTLELELQDLELEPDDQDFLE